MDEGKFACGGIDINYNADMPYAMPRTGTGEEDQVATLHFAGLDGRVLGILFA